MFKELTDKISYAELEDSILKYWESERTFEKSISARKGKPTFTFYEGPPTANGRPGIHHVLSRTIKDVVCRYKTMAGYQVLRKGGWDTHGLPVEIEVEKTLGFKHKDEIVEYGIEKFNKACYESVFKYLNDWNELTRRIAYWVDLENAYVTYTNEYIESVWWALKQFFDRGYIYKGYKSQPYCPRCETSLSSHEVALGYEDVKDQSVYVKFKLKHQQRVLHDRDGGTSYNLFDRQLQGIEVYFLVWTTTPWTLPSNVALAVHKDVEYVIVESKGEDLILSKAALEEPSLSDLVFGSPHTWPKVFGEELLDLEYEPLFDYVAIEKRAYHVGHGGFVSTEEGTGIVHIAPAFGEDDYKFGLQHKLPFVQLVDKSGNFTPEAKDFAGKFVKDADPEIIENLRRRHILYKKKPVVHSYPHCWRCKTPLLYYARESWYIATTKFVERMIQLNKTIHWYPEEVGTGRFGNWLEENKDWSLSRERFWGTPLPIWICEKCGKQKAVGSIAELREGQNVPEPLNLHKPYVDAVTFTCRDCGAVMRRTSEVIDAWFDSGSMPFAQYHYPFENKKLFEAHYPADFIAEGIDQTRGWFYSLHAIGTFLFDQPAYKNLIVNELILDKEGKKMSKSAGNIVDPFELVSRYGADTVRWYLITNSPPWRATLFDEDGLVNVQAGFFRALINVYGPFFARYANLDGFSYRESEILPAKRREIDRWILSELNSLIKRYREAMEGYDITRAAREVSDFTIDALSNWYVRRNRPRFWSKWSNAERRDDKLAAYQTLYECLVTVAKLMAPFAPFFADELYRDLNNASRREPEESVHLCSIPKVNEKLIDLELEKKMSLVRRVVSLTRALRTEANVKVRQPLSRMMIAASKEDEHHALQPMEGIILDEVNVKKIEFIESDSSLVGKKAKPNFKSIGPKFGKKVQMIAERIKALDRAEIQEVEMKGEITLAVGDQPVVITRDDIEIHSEEIKGWLVESENGLTVAIDTTLTEDLIQEGLAREVINRIQRMRKDAGFEVIDRIKVYYRTTEKLAEAVNKFDNTIKTETLALDLSQEFSPGEHAARWDINGESCEIGVERVK
jgi:isoleucyl-tRNA synthetase